MSLLSSEKISNIRKEIGTSSSYAEVTQIQPQFQKEVTMTVFEAIDSKIWKKEYSTLNRQPAILTHFPHLFSKVCLTV